jgi:sialic acid synthase SpsE
VSLTDHYKIVVLCQYLNLIYPIAPYICVSKENVEKLQMEMFKGTSIELLETPYTLQAAMKGTHLSESIC